jgi:hypothetical protein
MAEEKFPVGTPITSKCTFYGARGEVVGDYTNCGHPELRQIMFGSGPGRFSVTMRVDELRVRRGQRPNAFDRYLAQFRQADKDYFTTDCAFRDGQLKSAKRYVKMAVDTLEETVAGRIFDCDEDRIIEEYS